MVSGVIKIIGIHKFMMYETESANLDTKVALNLYIVYNKYTINASIDDAALLHVFRYTMNALFVVHVLKRVYITDIKLVHMKFGQYLGYKKEFPKFSCTP